MKERQEHLRQLFESKTDIHLSPENTAWQKYALWLESLQTRNVVNKIIKENTHLRNTILNVIDTLDKAITNPLKD